MPTYVANASLVALNDLLPPSCCVTAFPFILVDSVSHPLVLVVIIVAGIPIPNFVSFIVVGITCRYRIPNIIIHPV